MVRQRRVQFRGRLLREDHQPLRTAEQKSGRHSTTRTVLENVGLRPETRHLDMTEWGLSRKTTAGPPMIQLSEQCPLQTGTGGSRESLSSDMRTRSVSHPRSDSCRRPARILFLLLTSRFAGTERAVPSPSRLITLLRARRSYPASRGLRRYAGTEDSSRAGPGGGLLNTGGRARTAEGNACRLYWRRRGAASAALHGELEFFPAPSNPFGAHIVSDRVPRRHRE